MSHSEVAHIGYERVEHPHATIVSFLSHSIANPTQAQELGSQLAMLVPPDATPTFVLDFKDVRTFSSTAFGALVSFVFKVRKAGGRVVICNMADVIRMGADIIRLGDYAPIVADRGAALDRLAADTSAVSFVS